MPITDKSKVDQDIKNFLEQVEITTSPEYMKGRQDAIEEQNGRTHEAALSEIVEPAERYFHFLKDIKKISPVQFRIGMDQATRSPAIVVVLSKAEEHCVSELMDISRGLELFFWEEKALDLNIWTLVDDHLDVKRLERDYPYFRKTV